MHGPLNGLRHLPEIDSVAGPHVLRHGNSDRHVDHLLHTIRPTAVVVASSVDFHRLPLNTPRHDISISRRSRSVRRIAVTSRTAGRGSQRESGSNNGCDDGKLFDVKQSLHLILLSGTELALLPARRFSAVVHSIASVSGNARHGLFFPCFSRMLQNSIWQHTSKIHGRNILRRALTECSGVVFLVSLQ